MASTLPRAPFLDLLAQLGHASSAALAEQALDRLGWGDKQDFTKGDVLTVMEAMTAMARETLAADPESAVGTTPEERAHLDGMLASLQQHAVPLLRDQVGG